MTLRAVHLGLVAAACGALTLVACGGSGRPVVAPSGPAAAIDALMASIYSPGQPGAVVLVARNGVVVLKKAYGLANVELETPMQPDMVMPLASLSKAFTAAGILALAEQGRLSLRDDITRFLPGYRAHGQPITIEHLLTHTSGISSLSETADMRASASPDVRVTDLLTDWVRDLPPDAPPGERWAYSNWGYHLLAAIIERASGASYQEFLQRTILDPLGLRQTYYLDRRRIVPRRASGYEVQADSVFNVVPSRSRTLQPNGAAGWMSTVDDLARWSAALDGTRVLTRASIDAMFTPYRLADGSSTGYGYGWDLGEYQGRRIQEHQGGTGGFVTHIVRIPEEGVFVAILSNRSQAAVPLQATAHRVAALAIGRPVPDPVAVPVERSALEGLAGSYRGSDVGTCTVAVAGGGLTAAVPGLGTLALVAVAPATFRSTVVTWTFSFDTDAEGRGLRMRVRDWKLNDVAERFSPRAAVSRPTVAVAGPDLDACAGEYESLNGILVKVERAGDHLAVTPFAQPRVEVFPVASLVFQTSDGAAEYRFVRDAGGAIAGYQRSAGGTPVPARRLR
jgi:D-alanyl-D-alanine carboxypeptidase